MLVAVHQFAATTAGLYCISASSCAVSHKTLGLRLLHIRVLLTLLLAQILIALAALVCHLQLFMLLLLLLLLLLLHLTLGSVPVLGREHLPQRVRNSQHDLREAARQHADEVVVCGHVLGHAVVVVIEPSLATA
jgi:hypothetical protein